MNLRSLVLYTRLPRLYDMYRIIVSLTPVMESGYSLAGASGFLLNMEIPVTHHMFWEVMSRFLSVHNEKFHRELKQARKRSK